MVLARSTPMKTPLLASLVAGACWWLGGASPEVRAQGPASVTAVPPTAPAVADSAFPRPISAPYNDLILQQIRTMPQAGGYSAGHEATQRLGSALLFTSLGGLNVEAARAEPSYCSGATYLVFMKTVNALCRSGSLTLSAPAYGALLISGQRDGQGVWGRWNANGPGTARLFYEMNLGPNFSDMAQARAGDFMKIFWSPAVGRREHGHSVVFIDTEKVNGVDSLRFWSSNIGVGYSEKTVPLSRVSAVVFSRLTNPQNLAHAATLSPAVDPYLSGLLTKDSSLAEVHAKCGM